MNIKARENVEEGGGIIGQTVDHRGESRKEKKNFQSTL